MTPSPNGCKLLGTFLKEIQTAAECVAIRDPTDFDAKMALEKLCPPFQAPAIAGLKEQFLSDWRTALAFEQKLDATLPPLHKALDSRKRILQQVAQLMIGSERPWTELGAPAI